jgi:2-C-methyl-D-erythritol 4-phosphate cytidylyltransferase
MLQNQYLILVAGGVGSRMNNATPKQFIEMNGEAMIIRTLRCFLNYNPGISVVISIHKDFTHHLKNLIHTSGLTISNLFIAEGGVTRFESVKNGLSLIHDNDAIVAIHDAARPFVSIQTIATCFNTAAVKGNATPCVALNESVRKVSENESVAVNRDEYKLIQTPQCFLVSKIKRAFEQAYTPMFTDDATVLEAMGEKINLVEGNIENIKITNPHDLLIAQALLNK